MITKLKSTDFTSSTISAITGPTITSVQIASDITYATILDDTAVSTSGGYIIINGTGFVSGCQVYIDSTISTSVSFVSSTRINVQVPASTSGTYVIYLVNPDGSMAIRINGITYSTFPAWSTGSTLADLAPSVLVSLNATSDSSVTYSLEAGSSLPPGISLSSAGLLSGTWTGSVTTTYNFTVVATDTELQNTSRTFSVTIIINDPNFPYTTLLLSASDTPNTWTQDASTNKFLMTVTGDTRPNAFSPYGAMWSTYYTGTADNNGTYLASNTAYSFGTGDFTVEAWVNISPISNTNGKIIVDARPDSTNGAYWLFGFNNAGRLTGTTMSTGGVTITSTNPIPTNQWVHVAYTRASGVLNLWVNGSSVATASGNTDNISSSNLWIGRLAFSSVATDSWFAGYMSNLRIVKGVAVYTGTFTTPTSPFTATQSAGINIVAITGTQTSLLIHQSNRFVDKSNINATVLTLNTWPTISSFSPFVETDTTTGSAYFDGTGDYLIWTGSAVTTAFTFECWFYYTGTFAAIAAFVGPGSAVTNALNLYINNSTQFTYDQYGIAGTSFTVPAMSANQWYHVAFVRNASNVATVFLNGVRSSTGTATISTAFANIAAIGYVSSAVPRHWIGYLSDIRYLNSAVYDPTQTTITVPTTSLTAIANTQLLTLQYRLGENNSRFIDESGLNHVVTRLGNTTQGTLTPFSKSSGYWSVYSVGATTTGTLPAFGNAFTIEMWVYYTGSASGELFMSPTGIVFQMQSGQPAITFQGTWSGAAYGSVLTAGNWYYLAAVREGTGTNQLKVYVNGVAGSSGTKSDTQASSTYTIGANFNGYISNIRVSKDTARYTGNFTPPTTPLIADANTTFLAFRDNRFIETVANYTLTPASTTSIQPFSPFVTSSGYSAATVGGSAYFDGTGDQLTAPNNTAFAFGSGNFTVEMWAYATGTVGSLANYSNGVSANSNWAWDLYQTSATGIQISLFQGATQYVASSAIFSQNAWNHIAAVRNGNTMTIYINGIAGGTTSTVTGVTANDPASSILKVSGYSNASSMFTGYACSIRIIKGQALTSGNFTPPTSPVTTTSVGWTGANVSTSITGSVSLLLNFTNAGIKDSSSKNALETLGNVSITNAQAKFNVGSLYFDGAGDYLQLPVSKPIELGGSNWTIEFWLYLPTLPSIRSQLTYLNANTSGYAAVALQVCSSNKLGLSFSESGASWKTDDTTGVGSVLTAATWQHVAVVRNGQNIQIYLNGVAQGAAYTTTAATTSLMTTYTLNLIGIYNNNPPSSPLNGYIDDFRITNGLARYTAGFTAPTSAFLTR